MYDIQPFAFARSPAFGSLFRLFDSWPYDAPYELPQDAADTDWLPAAPPYELRQLDERAYELTLAVPGFSDQDLSVEVQGNRLQIRGEQRQDEADQAPAADRGAKKAGKQASPPARYAPRGFAVRQFQRQFELGEHVRIADAKLANGLLTIQLARDVPAAQKPRQIKITRG